LCELDYIPAHLCKNSREPIAKFEIGENLYFRCLSKQLTYPYKSLSLATLSHNRDFANPEVYSSDDVLWNIKPDDDERFSGYEVAQLKIKSTTENTFLKKLVSELNPELYLIIKLVHTPEECMFPHSEFKFYLMETEVTMDNYDQTLNVKSGINKKALRELRTDARMELKSMLATGLIAS
jgi:hypothetical protein